MYLNFIFFCNFIAFILNRNKFFAFNPLQIALLVISYLVYQTHTNCKMGKKSKTSKKGERSTSKKKKKKSKRKKGPFSLSKKGRAIEAKVKDIVCKDIIKQRQQTPEQVDDFLARMVKDCDARLSKKVG